MQGHSFGSYPVFDHIQDLMFGWNIVIIIWLFSCIYKIQDFAGFCPVSVLSIGNEFGESDLEHSYERTSQKKIREF